MHVVVVFTLNRSFYPTTSAVHPVSVLILHPREMQILWSQTVRQRKTKRWRIKVGKSSTSVYRVRDVHGTKKSRNLYFTFSDPYKKCLRKPWKIIFFSFFRFAGPSTLKNCLFIYNNSVPGSENKVRLLHIGSKSNLYRLLQNPCFSAPKTDNRLFSSLSAKAGRGTA